MSALLQIGNLSVGGLADVSMELRAGEVMAVLGANGAGKTTLLRALVGELEPANGNIFLDGTDLAGMPSARRARLGIGYCPAGRRVFPGLSVEDNLDVACFASAVERARRKGEAMALFPQLARFRKSPAWRLSGGQQQMLAIARALVGAPRLLLLDEPSLGLAPILVDELLGKLRQIAGRGAAVLLAEQNLGAALSIADRWTVLARGRVAAFGDAAERDRAAGLSMQALGLQVGS